MPEAPIGAIVAYGGPVDADVEAATGWMLCDGRQLNRTHPEHTALFDAIGFSWGGDGANRFNLPDLRGYFLRGVDERKGQDSRDPDGERRTANLPGGRTGAAVGTVQAHATAMPERPNGFVTEMTGGHAHDMDFELSAARDVDGVSNTVAYPSLTSNWPSTQPVRNHQHQIFGGDRETRPRNAYVNWIIRVQ